MVAFRQAGVRGVISLFARAPCPDRVNLAWTFLDRASVRERMAERRALDQRMGELAAHAIAPHSALACLDAMAGDTVEAACEKAVFASPEAVAAAVSYVAARLTLLGDAAAYAESSDPAYETVVAPMRLALETDRFGIVAHVFAMRDSCTALQCDSLAVLRDTSRVQSNLRERTFDRLHHALRGRLVGAWSAAPVAEGGGTPSTLASTGSVPAPGVPVSSRYDFPSAASIPPVSIMNAEPERPRRLQRRPWARTAAAAPIPPRRPARTATPRSPAPESEPVQLSPPPAGGQSLR